MEVFLVEEDFGLRFDRGFGCVQRGDGNGILDKGNSIVRIVGNQVGVGEWESFECQFERLDFMLFEGLVVDIVLLVGRLRVRFYYWRSIGFGQYCDMF